MIIERQKIYDYVKESNAIERILRDPTDKEVDELIRFVQVKEMSISEIENFVKVYQPDAQMRDKYDMNVRVGNYLPPFGGPEIRMKLEELIKSLNCGHFFPSEFHIYYEKLHPFTDGNGRSGRALYLWHALRHIKSLSNGFPSVYENGFLLDFYFNTLSGYPNKRIL